MALFDRLKRPTVATVAVANAIEPELLNDDALATLATLATATEPKPEPVFYGDDRITCRRCDRLHGGLCGAAKDRTLPNTGPRYTPEPERLRRCLAYVPALLEPDKRTGLERWPYGR